MQADGAGAEGSPLIRAVVAHREEPILPTDHADLASVEDHDPRDAVLEIGLRTDVNEG
jgi:hypothetical protein